MIRLYVGFILFSINILSTSVFSKSDCFDLMTFLKEKKELERTEKQSLSVEVTDINIESFTEFDQPSPEWIGRFGAEVINVGLYFKRIYDLAHSLEIIDCKTLKGSAPLSYSVLDFDENTLEFGFAPYLHFEVFKPMVLEAALSTQNFEPGSSAELDARRAIAKSIDSREDSIKRMLKTLRFTMSRRDDGNLDISVELETGDEQTEFHRFRTSGVAYWGTKPKDFRTSEGAKRFQDLYQQGISQEPSR